MKRTHEFSEFAKSAVACQIGVQFLDAGSFESVSKKGPLEVVRIHKNSVQIMSELMYTVIMNVAITDLRAHLSDWLDQARAGEEIVVTDRGVPIARLIGLDSSLTLERLTLEGLISRPTVSTRIKARGRRRPTPSSSVADLVSEQRR